MLRRPLLIKTSHRRLTARRRYYHYRLLHASRARALHIHRDDHEETVNNVNPFADVSISISYFVPTDLKALLQCALCVLLVCLYLLFLVSCFFPSCRLEPRNVTSSYTICFSEKKFHTSSRLIIKLISLD